MPAADPEMWEREQLPWRREGRFKQEGGGSGQ